MATKVYFNGVSIGGSNESLAHAGDQAHEAKNQEGSRWDSQAGEEAEEARRQDGKRGRRETGISLAVFRRRPGNPRREQLRLLRAIAGATLAVAFSCRAWNMNEAHLPEATYGEP
ncbi:MAG: hypothetical protein AAB133_04085 [Pseudomonadota bacterium]